MVNLSGVNYAGIVEGTYRILAKDHDISKASFKIDAKSYTGEPINLKKEDILNAEIKINKVKTSLTLDEDFVIVGYDRNVNRGTAQVTFKGIGKFGGEKTVSFKIGTRSIEEFWKGIYRKIVGILKTEENVSEESVLSSSFAGVLV